MNFIVPCFYHKIIFGYKAICGVGSSTVFPALGAMAMND